MGEALERPKEEPGAVLALYADDAVFLPSTGSRVAGRAAIRDLFTKALAGNHTQIQIRSQVTEASGNLAYDSGEYKDDDDRWGHATGKGNYLVVLRRSGDRGWKIVEHMWTERGGSAMRE